MKLENVSKIPIAYNSPRDHNNNLAINSIRLLNICNSINQKMPTNVQTRLSTPLSIPSTQSFKFKNTTSAKNQNPIDHNRNHDKKNSPQLPQ